MGFFDNIKNMFTSIGGIINTGKGLTGLHGLSWQNKMADNAFDYLNNEEKKDLSNPRLRQALLPMMTPMTYSISYIKSSNSLTGLDLMNLINFLEKPGMKSLSTKYFLRNMIRGMTHIRGMRKVIYS